MARGGFHVPAKLTSPLLVLILKKVAGVPAEVVRQLQTLSGWDVQAFCPSAPAGATPMVLPAELHFSNFMAAFMTVLEYGMEDAPPACTTTVATLRHSLDTVEKSVWTYLQFHAHDLAPFSQKVRKLLVTAMNRGLEEATHKLALAAASVWRQHSLMPPPVGAGPTFQHPAFAQLLALVEEGAANSLVSRIDLWARPRATTPGGGNTKRKSSPGASRSKRTITRGRASPGRVAKTSECGSSTQAPRAGSAITRGGASTAPETFALSRTIRSPGEP